MVTGGTTAGDTAAEAAGLRGTAAGPVGPVGAVGPVGVEGAVEAAGLAALPDAGAAGAAESGPVARNLGADGAPAVPDLAPVPRPAGGSNRTLPVLGNS